MTAITFTEKILSTRLPGLSTLGFTWDHLRTNNLHSINFMAQWKATRKT